MKTKLIFFRMLSGSRSERGLTLNQIMATVGIAGIVTLVGFNGYQRAILTTNQVALEQEARRAHQLMEEIFTNQNPNEYPPEQVLPVSVQNWAAPTNFQAAGELDQIIDRWQSNGRGSVTLEYKYPAPQGYELKIQSIGLVIMVNPVGITMHNGSSDSHSGCHEGEKCADPVEDGT